MRKLLLLAVVALLLATVGVAAAEGTGTATGIVVHGIPGVVVDVYVDGALRVPGFTPGTIVGPIPFPAGTYQIDIVPAGQPISAAVISAPLTFSAGQSFSLIAHLDLNGNPTASVFDNDLSPTANARLYVRHLANAPTVEALFFPGTSDEFRAGPLSNGQEGVFDLPAGSYTAGIIPAGGTANDIVYGPFSRNLEAGNVYIAYAVGTLADGTFEVLVQKIPVGQ